MSPHAVNNFVSDLVLMAQAMEELPKVKAELDRANDQVEAYAKQVQALEMRLIDRNAEIDTLHSNIRSLEVARDDAELRFLEADDKSQQVVRLLGQIAGHAAHAEAIIVPPKPEPPVAEVVHSVEEVQAQPVEGKPEPSASYGVYDEASPVVHGEAGNVDSQSTGQGATDPTVSSMQTAPSTSVPIVEHQDTVHTMTSDPGQSATLPTAALPTGESTAEPQSASPSSDVNSPQPLKPYSGKFYYDQPSWISRDDWHAGGGDDYHYDWRPGTLGSQRSF